MEFDALGKNKVEEIFAEIRKWRRVTTASRYSEAVQPFHFFENFIKITCIIYAAESGNLLDRRIAVPQKLFGSSDFFGKNVLDDCRAIFFFEFVG